MYGVSLPGLRVFEEHGLKFRQIQDLSDSHFEQLGLKISDISCLVSLKRNLCKSQMQRLISSLRYLLIET